MDTTFAFDLLLALVVVEALTEAFVDADPLEPARHALGKLHPLVAVLVNCGKCTSFWVALVVSFLPTTWLVVLATPLATWRLANLWHDATSWVAFGKEKQRPEY